MNYLGNIVGFRPFTGKGKDGDFKAIEFYVLRAQPQEGVVGKQIDRFAAFDYAIGDYSPSLGDGLMYNLYYANGRQQCGFVLHNPDLDVEVGD